MIKLTKINNIEDAGDDFITEEELCEMLGEEYNEDKHYYRYNVIERSQAIVEALGALIAEAKRLNKKTIIIKDNDLIEVLKRGSASDHVKGLRRVGNRLYLHDKKPNVPKKANVTMLAYRVQWTVNKGNKVEIEIKYANHDVPATIALCKKLVSWEDIVWNADGYNMVDAETIGFCKQIWDNPNMFEKVTEEPKVAENA
jgi:hypothetical protein